MQENTENLSDEISLKEFILKIKSYFAYLLNRWITIVIIGFICGIIGFSYCWFQRPIYKAALTFVLEDQKSSSMGIATVASQFGVDIGGSAGGEFSGDNLLELMKSRAMIEKALLTKLPFKVNNKTETLAEFYIEINRVRDGWKDKPKLKNITYVSNDRSKFSREQDSVLGVFYQAILKNNLVVDKVDKKLSFIIVKVSSTNELFSKYFTEVLANVVSDFYIQTKIKKTSQNVMILQRQTDSVRHILNEAISGVATSAEVNPNPNPYLQTLHVPAQRKQIDVQANTVILTELVRNLEASKMTLLQETPLISVIDSPILPLEKDKPGRLKGALIGFFSGVFLSIIIISIRLLFKSILG